MIRALARTARIHRARRLARTPRAVAAPQPDAYSLAHRDLYGALYASAA